MARDGQVRAVTTWLTVGGIRHENAIARRARHRLQPRHNSPSVVSPGLVHAEVVRNTGSTCSSYMNRTYLWSLRRALASYTRRGDPGRHA